MSRRQPRCCDWCSKRLAATDEVWSEPRSWQDDDGSWQVTMFYVHQHCKYALDPWGMKPETSEAAQIE